MAQHVDENLEEQGAILGAIGPIAASPSQQAAAVGQLQWQGLYVKRRREKKRGGKGWEGKELGKENCGVGLSGGLYSGTKRER